VGLASIIIGVTNWLGDIGFMGFSAKSIGLMIAIGMELVLALMMILLWETK
jgi:hypothetical protein